MLREIASEYVSWWKNKKCSARHYRSWSAIFSILRKLQGSEVKHTKKRARHPALFSIC